MVSIFKKIFNAETAETPDYIEVDVGKTEEKKAKITIRPFILKAFDDTNKVLDVLREGYTVALIDIKPLKQKDLIELKRAISKIKKTVDALEGNIAGFGENTIVATPSFIDIFRADNIKPAQ